MKIAPYLFLTLVFFASCMQIEAPEIKSVVCCNLKKTGESDVSVTFELEIHNSNEFPILIKRYNLDVMMDGNLLGSSNDDQTKVLEPGMTKTVEVAVDITSKELMSGALMMGLNTLLNKKPKQLEVEVVGSVVGSAKGFSKKVRIREKYPINLQL